MSKSKNTTQVTGATPLETAYLNITVAAQQLFKMFVKDDLKKTSRSTLRNWLKGNSEPSAAEKIAIAKHLGKPVAELFPVQVNQ